MVTVYVIRGTSGKSRYVGITNNLSRRLRQHNQGVTRSTKNRGPHRLLYKEVHKDYVQARKREIFLKSGAGRKFLDSVESHS